MNAEHKQFGLFLFAAVLLVAGIGNVPTYRQKYAQIVPFPKHGTVHEFIDDLTPEQQDKVRVLLESEFTPKQLEAASTWLDSTETVLPEDPMDENGPIPNRPTDVEVVVPEGANEKPILVEELNIHIDAPIDAMVGDMVKLHANIVGTPTAIKWVIDPPVDDFETLDGGLRAVFSNRNTGIYHVVCSVAGNNGHVDVDTHTFEIVPQPPENPLTPQTIAQLTPQLSVEDLIKRALAGVKSANKIGEAHAIAGSFRSVANSMRGGNLLGPDPLRSVEEAGEIAVGPAAFRGWREYFGYVRELLLPLNAAKVVYTPEQYANTFENIASVMETLTTMESR